MIIYKNFLTLVYIIVACQYFLYIYTLEGILTAQDQENWTWDIKVLISNPYHFNHWLIGCLSTCLIFRQRVYFWIFASHPIYLVRINFWGIWGWSSEVKLSIQYQYYLCPQTLPACYIPIVFKALLTTLMPDTIYLCFVYIYIWLLPLLTSCCLYLLT